MADEQKAHEPLFRNISDTARWVAVYRARESARPDAVFRDPLAERLAGERGREIAAAQPFSEKHSWSFVARTWLFDHFIAQEVGRGADTVINLAAGLDTRPYRMPLPPALRWIEVDLPELLAYKEDVLRGEKPVCQLERVALDLTDVSARRALFARLGGASTSTVVVTEGLIIYLARDEVGALARDLALQPSFRRWVIDITSPGLMAMLQKNTGALQETAPFRFAPEEGPAFYASVGWPPLEVRSMLQAAGRLKRLHFPMNIFALLPEPKQPAGKRPWGGVVLLGRG